MFGFAGRFNTCLGSREKNIWAGFEREKWDEVHEGDDWAQSDGEYVAVLRVICCDLFLMVVAVKLGLTVALGGELLST